jgi:hypothetical protein
MQSEFFSEYISELVTAAALFDRLNMYLANRFN